MESTESTESTPAAATPAQGTKKGSELTPYQRGLIQGGRDCGLSFNAISKSLNIPRSTVATTIKTNRKRIDGESLPRSGRPKALSEADERLIIRCVRKDPKATHEKICADTGVTCSKATVSRLLKSKGIHDRFNLKTSSRDIVIPPKKRSRAKAKDKDKDRPAPEPTMPQAQTLAMGSTGFEPTPTTPYSPFTGTMLADVEQWNVQH